METARTSLNVEEALYHKVKVFAAENRVTVTEVVNDALIMYLMEKSRGEEGKND